MNITYTGKQEHLHPEQQTNLETKIAKISKLIESNGQGDKKAHFILDQHKSKFRAEITLNYLDHALIGEHSDSEQFTAISVALDKLEKQLLKVRDKRRDIKKGPREIRDREVRDQIVEVNASAIPEVRPGQAAETNGKPRIYRVAPADSKPMTLDEAVLVIDDDYLVYHDANTNHLSVLLRRGDGNFDLVEC